MTPPAGQARLAVSVLSDRCQNPYGGNNKKERKDIMSLPRPMKAVPVSKGLQPEHEGREKLLFKGYPHHCYIEDPYSGRTGVIYPGDKTIYKPEKEFEATMNPDELNRQYGVTSGQVQACWYGVMHGWDYARANPMAYNLAGDYLGV